MKNFKVYLAGPIEASQDYGTSWRNEIIPKMTSYGLEGVNPMDKAVSQYQEGKELHDRINQLRQKNKVWALHEIATAIVEEDRDLIKDCDGLLLSLKSSTPTVGSWSELDLAHSLGLPIVVWLREGSYRDLPIWAMGYVDPDHVTLNRESALKILKQELERHDQSCKTL